jgi:hypothetical protein
MSAAAFTRETKVFHKDGRKFLMEVDASPSARDILNQPVAVIKAAAFHTASRPAPANMSDVMPSAQFFSDDVLPTQSRDLEHLKSEILREQQKLLSVVEQQGAVLQDMQSRLQHQQLSPAKPSQPKRHTNFVASSEMDGPAARHLKCKPQAIFEYLFFPCAARA